jgi:predicted ATP-dependent protease
MNAGSPTTVGPDPGRPQGRRPVRPPRPLPASALYRRCPLSLLRFRSTADLPQTETIVGQDRALEAIDLALDMPGTGFDVFAMGPPGIGKATALHQRLSGRAASEAVADDWCYVYGFSDPQRPKALRLPAGRAAVLEREMAELTAELPGVLLAAFESDAYREQRDALESRLAARSAEALGALEQRASAGGIAVVRTPVGLALAPTRDGQALGPDEFRSLPEAEQAATREALELLGEEMEALLRTLPRWQRETRDQVRQLDREVSAAAVRHLVDDVRQRFGDLPDVLAYLAAVEADIVERTAEIVGAARRADAAAQPVRVGPEQAGTQAATQTSAAAGASEATRPDPGARPVARAGALTDEGVLRRYRVNVLVDRGAETGAPFVTEDHPTVANLIGRVEYLAQMGTLVTDFLLIEPGALHRANGGYLVLEAAKLLAEPFAWQQLKRALRAGAIHIESMGQTLGLISTVSLEPEPIPLRVKIALSGDRVLYYLLSAVDPDFPELFRIEADFEDEVDRTPEAIRAYATLMGTLAARERLRPLEPGGVARAIEHLARMAADNRKLSTHMGRLTDLLREADHAAGVVGRRHIGAAHVQAAIDARLRRAGRVRERLQEALLRGRLNVRTDGRVVGQVNALSVMQLGDVFVGHPSRVSARTRLGDGEIVDIEREAELGGPIHSKGVLILSGFLSGRFGSRPLSVTASLVFEQSYAGVEGDSASLAELCALLSALAALPIAQAVAVTGSIDQHGEVQAVGGVNDKIEGFFDTCAARGLSGEQGVIIPRSNVDDLMLSERVVEAARARRFHVWPVASADEAMTLLTGLPAGRPSTDGSYPAGTVNGTVARALEDMARSARRWSRGRTASRDAARGGGSGR